MAENDQAQEKTEEPTQRRLEKAREDGDVLSSKEMFVFASSAAGLFVLAVLGLFSGKILNGWSQLFIFSHPEELAAMKIKNVWQGYRLLLLFRQLVLIQCFVVLFDSLRIFWCNAFLNHYDHRAMGYHHLQDKYKVLRVFAYLVGGLLIEIRHD